MKRFTLVLSDVHLATAVRTGGGWMAYRRPENSVDGPLAGTILAAFRQAAQAGAELTIILNGDILDPDAPAPDGTAPADTREDEGAAKTVDAILRDHPLFVRALATAASAGARIVWVPGNHDDHVALPSVRRAISARLLGSGGGRPPSFASWIHRTPDGVLAEHGHVYDGACAPSRMHSARDPQGRIRLEDTVGSTSTRYVPGLFGTSDPFVPDPFAEGNRLAKVRSAAREAPAGLREWIRGVAGYLRDVASIDARPSDEDPRWLGAVSRETGLAPSTLALHRSMWSPKADARVVAGGLVGDVDYGRAIDARLVEVGLRIGRLHGVGAVVMGHTHVPRIVRDPSGVLYANSGTWAPSSSRRPFVGSFLWFESGDGSMRGALRYVRSDGSVA